MSLKRNDKIWADTYIATGNRVLSALAIGDVAERAGIVAHNMMSKPSVKSYVDGRFQKMAQDKTDLAERVRDELAQMAFANIADYVSLDHNGNAVVDLTTVTRDQMAAVSEVTTIEYENGTIKTKIKLTDKQNALNLLGKHVDVQAFKEKSEVKVTTDIENMTDEEIEQELAQLKLVVDNK